MTEKNLRVLLIRNTKHLKTPNIFQKLSRKVHIVFELLKGYDFLKVIPLEELNLDSKIVFKGSPSGNKYLTRLFESLSITNNDKILDIGCAKGSALKVMLNFPFKKIDGLELSPELVEIAERNFQKLKTNNVEIFNKNASNFEGYNNYNYFYLYNPFPESVFKLVLKKMQEQIKHKKIFIIYNNPLCHDLLINNHFEFLKKYDDAWGNGINLYAKIF